jgi:hypothetical protein
VLQVAGENVSTVELWQEETLVQFNRRLVRRYRNNWPSPGDATGAVVDAPRLRVVGQD